MSRPVGVTDRSVAGIAVIRRMPPLSSRIHVPTNTTRINFGVLALFRRNHLVIGNDNGLACSSDAHPTAMTVKTWLK